MAIIQGTSKSSAAGFSIDQSIRFNDDDSAYLTKTFASDGNRRTWTFSTWVKFANIKADNVLFSSWISSGASAYQLIYIDGADKLRLEDQSNNRLITNQVFRDVGAWYHVVARVDTTDATSSDRFQLYINGDRVTSFSTETQPSLNFEGNINKGSQPHYLGRNGYSLAMLYSDLYQAETHFIDGTALDPTSFGETNADTGQWVPIAYTGSYGTNGFYITGADSADLGADDSGNGNNFTSSGLTAADQVSDSPTDNFCTMSSINKYSGLTLADGNLKVSAGAQALNKVNGTFWVDADQGGAWYFEYTVGSSNDQLPGWTGSERTDKYPGQSTDSYSYAWARNGGAAYNPAGSTSAHTGSGTYASGDVLGWLIDFDNNEVKVGKVSSGTWSATITWTDLGTYKDGGPAGGAWTATDRPYNGNGTFNFGQTGGFAASNAPGQALKTSNLSDPTIADPSAYFQTSLWNGNGSTQTITQDGNSTFQPGWIWSKGRNNAQEHVVFDEVRGTTKYLKVSPVGTEGTQSGVTAFNSDGFDLGSWAVTNGSGQTHVGWQWKAGGTSGSSNTDGSITSTVSANTTAGFSIVTYTGTGSAATIGHGLGVAPAMVIVKKRVSGTDDAWIIWHQELSGPNYYLNFDSGAPDTSVNYWNNTLPTSSVFSVGASNGTNQSSKTFVAYCFAEVEGFSKIGSYTGNGSTDGAFVYTGFKPAFLLWKQYTNLGTNSWGIRDSARDPSNVVESVLRPDTAGAETTASSAYADFLSNGFKLRATDGFVNKAASNYLYYAVAESPFKTATAR